MWVHSKKQGGVSSRTHESPLRADFFGDYFWNWRIFINFAGAKERESGASPEQYPLL